MHHETGSDRHRPARHKRHGLCRLHVLLITGPHAGESPAAQCRAFSLLVEMLASGTLGPSIYQDPMLALRLPRLSPSTLTEVLVGSPEKRTTLWRASTRRNLSFNQTASIAFGPFTRLAICPLRRAPALA